MQNLLVHDQTGLRVLASKCYCHALHLAAIRGQQNMICKLREDNFCHNMETYK